MTNSRHFVRQASFGPSLESDRLPIVGRDRHRHEERARILRRVVLGLVVFWAIIIGVVIGKVF